MAAPLAVLDHHPRAADRARPRRAPGGGRAGIWANLLNLKPGTREHFLESLSRDWPEQLPHYEQLYAGKAYLPRAEVDPLRNRVRALAREHGIRDRRRGPPAPPPVPVQLGLGV